MRVQITNYSKVQGTTERSLLMKTPIDDGYMVVEKITNMMLSAVVNANF